MTLACLDTLGVNSLKQGDTFYSVLTGNKVSLGEGEAFSAHSPIDGAKLSQFNNATPAQLEAVNVELQDAFKALRKADKKAEKEKKKQAKQEQKQSKHQVEPEAVSGEVSAFTLGWSDGDWLASSQRRQHAPSRPLWTGDAHHPWPATA